MPVSSARGMNWAGETIPREGMGPPKEGLETLDFPRFQGNHRLVKNPELPFFKSVPQVGLQGKILDGPHPHCKVVHLKGIFRMVPGLVQGEVGIPEDFLPLAIG